MLAKDGRIEAVFGYEECGQGLLATLEQMLIEQFGFDARDIRLIIGDTDVVPNSGSTTASRATSMIWKSLQNLHPVFTAQLLETAGRHLAMPIDQLMVGANGIRAKHNPAMLLITY